MIFKKQLLASVSFFLLPTLSWGMIVRYKNEESMKTAISYGKPISAKFAQEERERWATLPQEEQDFCKLEKLYKNQNNPKFVAHFLKKYKPGVLLLSCPRDNDNEYRCYAINPYEKACYKNPDKQFFDKDKEIVDFGKNILKRALIQKRLDTSLDVKYLGPDCKVDSEAILIADFLFGDDKVISKAFEKMDLDNSAGNYDFLNAVIVACSDYSSSKNNTINLLLSKIQQKFYEEEWDVDAISPCLLSRQLLYSTAKNKEVFALVAEKDPYQHNRQIYQDYGQLTTNLEWMMKEKNHFDQEHIDIFMRDGGAMTAAEAGQMYLFGKVLHHATFNENRRVFWNTQINIINDRISHLLRQTNNREESREVIGKIVNTLYKPWKI